MINYLFLVWIGWVYLMIAVRFYGRASRRKGSPSLEMAIAALLWPMTIIVAVALWSADINAEEDSHAH